MWDWQRVGIPLVDRKVTIILVKMMLGCELHLPYQDIRREESTLTIHVLGM